MNIVEIMKTVEDALGPDSSVTIRPAERYIAVKVEAYKGKEIYARQFLINLKHYHMGELILQLEKCTESILEYIERQEGGGE